MKMVIFVVKSAFSHAFAQLDKVNASNALNDPKSSSLLLSQFEYCYTYISFQGGKKSKVAQDGLNLPVASG